jgi:hypothetical protein
MLILVLLKGGNGIMLNPFKNAARIKVMEETLINSIVFATKTITALKDENMELRERLLKLEDINDRSLLSFEIRVSRVEETNKHLIAKVFY